MSGLNQQFTKLSALNWAREFESRSLRNDLYACTSICISSMRVGGSRLPVPLYSCMVLTLCLNGSGCGC